jgi:hypothetical protein
MSDVASPQIAAASSPVVFDNLARDESQRPFVEPMLRIRHLGNTVLDALFYDVDALSIFNSCDRVPEHQVFTHHRTNSFAPLSMQTAPCVSPR